MALPPTIADLLSRGELAAAREHVRERLGRHLAPGDRHPAPDERRSWAEAAEAVGSSLLALQAWQAVLAEEPDAVDALRRLADLHTDRGDRARAQACQARLRDMVGEDPRLQAVERPGDELPPEPPGEPGTGDIVRFASLFSGREGVHARQWADKGQVGYSPVQGSLTPELAAAHLRGDVTLGSYLVRRDDTVSQLVFDLDATKAAVAKATGDAARARDLKRRIHGAGLALLEGLRAAGFAPLLVDSGYKGRHLWCMLPSPEPAGHVRAMGEAWARVLNPGDPELNIEVFPRQDRVPPGRLGNLLKLPLGVHLKTGRRCVLLDDNGQPIQDPWERLRSLEKVALSEIRHPPPSIFHPGPGGASDHEGRGTDQTGHSAETGAADAEGATGERDPASAALPAAPAPPPFTEGDFDARPRLAAILSGCGVIRATVDEALREARMERNARIVLEHSLGHLPEGVEAVNYLLRRAGAEDAELMGAPHSGSPVSCRNVRRRMGDLGREATCDCVFDVPDSYPHPILHARGVSARPVKSQGPPLEELLDTLLRTEARMAALERERDELRRQILPRIAELPGGELTMGDDTWRAEAMEGIPVLVRARAAQAGGG